MEKRFDTLRVDRREHGFMDRGDRARMAAREGDQVLIRLLDRAQPLAQMRNRALFEGDHRRHVGKENTPRAVNFLLNGGAHSFTRSSAPSIPSPSGTKRFPRRSAGA